MIASASTSRAHPALTWRHLSCISRVTLHGLGGYFYYEAGDVYYGGYDEGALRGSHLYLCRKPNILATAISAISTMGSATVTALIFCGW